MSFKITYGIECICSNCNKHFQLTSGDDEIKGERTYIKMRSCDSGGVYACYIECPHCQVIHNMM